jgi:hypothetical protein
MPQRRIVWGRVILVLVAVAVILLIACVALFTWGGPLLTRIRANMWKTDPQLAASAARSMLDYDLPPGYQELGVLVVEQRPNAVIMAHRERPTDLIFIQIVPNGILTNDRWRASYVDRLSKEMWQHRYNVRAVTTQTRVIRGQATTVTILEGTDENGRQIRQAICGLTGKSDDLLVALVASQATWNQALIDRFLQSIR